MKLADLSIDEETTEVDAKPLASVYSHTTGQTTTAGTLEEIAGSAKTITLTKEGHVLVWMAVEAQALAAPDDAVGEWAVSIDGTNKGPIESYLDDKKRCVTVVSRHGPLAAGSYVVKGMHRRISGVGTVQTLIANMAAIGTI